MGQDINVLLALYYASSHLSRLKDNSPSLEALQPESAICRSLITRISSTQQQADDFSIMAMLGMIAVDVEIWSNEHSETKEARLTRHIEGLRGMVSKRGGWSVFRNCAVTFLLHWFDILCSGEISLGLTPLSYPFGAPKNGESHLALYVQEFCAFYRSLLSHRVFYMHHPVEPRSLIGQMLSKNEDQIALERSAVLIYLCAVCNDLRHSSKRTNVLDDLDRRLAAQAMGPEASLAGVLWALCVDFESLSLEYPERNFLLSRILYVSKHFQADLRHAVDKQLLLFLISDRCDEVLFQAEDLELKIWRDINLVRSEAQ